MCNSISTTDPLIHTGGIVQQVGVTFFSEQGVTNCCTVAALAKHYYFFGPIHLVEV